MLYEPFGTQITPTSAFASANPTVPFAASTIPPANAQGSQSYAWAGGHRRSNETSFTLAPVQMGARVYIPSMGRFLSVDPVEGGTMNNYAYVADPINSDDYSGEFAFIPVIFAVARIAVAVAPIVMKAVRSPAVTRVIAQIASKASSVVQHVSRAVSGALNRAGGGSAGGTAANTGRAATSKATTTTVQRATPQMQGYQGMQAANIQQNTMRIPSLTGAKNFRVPDQLGNNVIGEVKNVKYQGLTSQIRDYGLYAQSQGSTFNLYIRSNARLSTPLLQYSDDGMVNIIKITMQ